MVDSESARGKQCVIKQLRPRSPAAQHEYRSFGTCALRLALICRLLFQNSRRWVHDGCSTTGVLDHWDRIMFEFKVGHIRKMSGRGVPSITHRKILPCASQEKIGREADMPHYEGHRKMLLNTCNRRFHRVHIRSQVATAGSSACSWRSFGAARPLFAAEPRVSAHTLFQIANAGRFVRNRDRS